jgi:hypothetical protein
MAGRLGDVPQQPENVATEPRVADNPQASRYELWVGSTRAGLIAYRSSRVWCSWSTPRSTPPSRARGWASGWSPAP